MSLYEGHLNISKEKQVLIILKTAVKIPLFIFLHAIGALMRLKGMR
jgi:hypothetical protein